MAFVAFKKKEDFYRGMDLAFRVMREFKDSYMISLQGKVEDFYRGIHELPQAMLDAFDKQGVAYKRLTEEEAINYLPESSKEFLKQASINHK